MRFKMYVIGKKVRQAFHDIFHHIHDFLMFIFRANTHVVLSKEEKRFFNFMKQRYARESAWGRMNEPR